MRVQPDDELRGRCFPAWILPREARREFRTRRSSGGRPGLCLGCVQRRRTSSRCLRSKAFACGARIDVRMTLIPSLCPSVGLARGATRRRRAGSALPSGHEASPSFSRERHLVLALRTGSPLRFGRRRGETRQHHRREGRQDAEDMADRHPHDDRGRARAGNTQSARLATTIHRTAAPAMPAARTC